MTVRSAYGVAFDLPHVYQYVAASGAPPYANRIGQAELGNWDDPWANFPGGNPFPLQFQADIDFPNSAYYSYYSREYVPPYAQQWNLSIQRQFGTDWMIAANYLGSTTIHIPTGEEMNYAVYTPTATTGNTEQRRIFRLTNPLEGGKYGTVVQVGSNGTQTYHGMNLSLQRRGLLEPLQPDPIPAGVLSMQATAGAMCGTASISRPSMRCRSSRTPSFGRWRATGGSQEPSE
jgi:hypothetical protein